MRSERGLRPPKLAKRRKHKSHVDDCRLGMKIAPRNFPKPNARNWEAYAERFSFPLGEGIGRWGGEEFAHLHTTHPPPIPLAQQRHTKHPAPFFAFLYVFMVFEAVQSILSRIGVPGMRDVVQSLLLGGGEGAVEALEVVAPAVEHVGDDGVDVFWADVAARGGGKAVDDLRAHHLY